MTSGFVSTGSFRPVFANDFNDWALESYRANSDKRGTHSHPGDLVELLDVELADIPRADVVVEKRQAA